VFAEKAHPIGPGFLSMGYVSTIATTIPFTLEIAYGFLIIGSSNCNHCFCDLRMGILSANNGNMGVIYLGIASLSWFGKRQSFHRQHALSRITNTQVHQNPSLSSSPPRLSYID
jgi:hypothetical protein